MGGVLLFKPFNTEEFTYIERNYNFFWVVNSCMVFFSLVVRSKENTNLASFDSSLTPSDHLNSPVVLCLTKISRSITLFFSADVILAYNRSLLLISKSINFHFAKFHPISNILVSQDHLVIPRWYLHTPFALITQSCSSISFTHAPFWNILLPLFFFVINSNKQISPKIYPWSPQITSIEPNSSSSVSFCCHLHFLIHFTILVLIPVFSG